MFTHYHTPVPQLTCACTLVHTYALTLAHIYMHSQTHAYAHMCTHTLLGLWDVCLRDIFIFILLSFTVFNPNGPIMVIITVHWAPLCSRNCTRFSLYTIPKAHKKPAGQILWSHFTDVVTGQAKDLPLACGKISERNSSASYPLGDDCHYHKCLEFQAILKDEETGVGPGSMDWYPEAQRISNRPDSRSVSFPLATQPPSTYRAA